MVKKLLPKISDQRGDLCHLSVPTDIPFEIKRVYTISAVPTGIVRGEHAHKKLTQFIFAASGLFTIELYDGHTTSIHTLSKLSTGVLVGPGIWRTLHSFTQDAVCVVLASELHDPNDYIWSLQEFHEFLDGKN